MQLSKGLFWDVDASTLDYVKNARFILERAFMRGKTSDIIEVLRHYGLDTAKENLVQSRYLDKLTLAFCCTLFHLKKEDFRCYRLSQSIPQHWPY